MESFRSRRRRRKVHSRFRARRQRFQASLVFVRVLLVKHLHLLLVLRGDFQVQFCVDGVHFFDHFVQFLVACDVIFVLDIFHVGVFAPKLRFGFIKKPFADFREERSEDAPGVRLKRFFQSITASNFERIARARLRCSSVIFFGGSV